MAARRAERKTSSLVRQPFIAEAPENKALHDSKVLK